MEPKHVVAIAVSILALTALIPICEATGEAQKFDTLKLQFENTSADALYIIWDFGDGTVLDGRWEHYVNNDGTLTAGQKTKLNAYKSLLAEHGGDINNPVHNYSKAGDYVTKLTAINPLGWNGYTATAPVDYSSFDGGVLGTGITGSSNVSSQKVTVENENGWQEYIPLAGIAAGIVMFLAGLYFGLHPVIALLGIAIALISALRYLGFLTF